MKWNLDFEIAAVLFEVLFLIFYFAKRHLPTKKNRFFIASMSMACFMTIMDMTSSVVDSLYWKVVPLPMLHIINVLFFVCASVNTMLMFCYVLALTEQTDIIRTPLFIIYSVPCFLSIILAITAPFTKGLYYIDPRQGYIQGPAFLTNFLLSAFYILLAAVYIFVYRRKMTRLQYVSGIFFLLILTTAIALQGLFFNWVLIANAASGFAICILYLSMQNPDLYIDMESGLFNRNGLAEYMQELISGNTRFSFLAICINNYRSMGGVYGEEKTKRALHDAIEYVRTNHTDQHLFRFSDDTYVVLTPMKYDMQEAMEKGRRKLESGFVVDGEHIRFTTTFIVLPYEQINNDVVYTFNLLEFALENVEGGVKGDIYVDDRIINRFRRHYNVQTAVELAVEKRSVQVYYMPIFSPMTEKMERIEALSRIFDEKVGFIPPREFILEAERNGSVVSLGREIFEKVCEFVKDQNPASYGIQSVSVNLSPMQLMQEGMAEEFISITRRYDVSMDFFSFDIMEITDIDKNKMVLNNMNKLIAAGAEFALDGYGSAFSSLDNIIRLPVNMVKIDRALVRAYFEKASLLLPDVIELLRNQNLKICLTGVETKDMARRLSVMGCDYLQGYFYSRTIPGRELVALMKKQAPSYAREA